MTSATILVVDDDAASRKVISLLLTNELYRVRTADSHDAAMREFRNENFDLVLLDVLMPGVDGWETCKQMRLTSDVPIMLVTALDHQQDMVRGLRIGADDFYVKPIERDLFLARVSALLRRSRILPKLSEYAQNDIIYEDSYLTINLASRRVFVNGESISLTPTELNLLGYLLRNAGQAVSYQQILNEVWDWEHDGRIGYVHTYVSRLRRKLERDANQPIYLVNEYGFGYRFDRQERTATNHKTASDKQ